MVRRAMNPHLDRVHGCLKKLSPADLNFDGLIDDADFSTFASASNDLHRRRPEPRLQDR